MACVKPYNIVVFFAPGYINQRPSKGLWGRLFNILVRPYLNPNMSHCWAVLCYESDHYNADERIKRPWIGVYLESNMYSMPVQLITEEVMFDMRGKYVSIDMDHPQRMIEQWDRVTFPINTCVGSVKKALGIKVWWVQTPYQLYKYLLKLKGQTNGDS